MPLPTPHLDDRRFQDLVDDAKRMVQQRCPEWTDHNVSDPGVTLIETFAFMVDQLLFRLNKVPDRTYVKFLELMGLELFPPSAARVPVTFWLSAPLEEDVLIELGTEVATRRRRSEEPVVFRTTAPLNLVTCQLDGVMTTSRGEAPINQTDELQRERPITMFQAVPQPDDSVMFGLTAAVPHCAVRLQIDCEIEGYGVDPDDPPLVWEALGDQGWVRCDVQDGTGGFNQPGAVIAHVPGSHTLTVQEGRSAGWLRCRVVATRDEDQPPYTASPLLRSVTAATVGGTMSAVHGEDVRQEIVGQSEGVGGQHFPLRNAPVIPAEYPVLLEASGQDGWQEWTQVDDFSQSGPDDLHWHLDPHAGEIVFGPVVRSKDGSLRRFGAIPAQGSHIRVRRYRFGGGSRGNIAAGEIATLTTAIPFVARVENRYSASGGVDAESLDEAKVRGPLVLGTRNRAVTADDYEHLAREASPEVARVRCLPVDDESRPVDDAAGGAAGVRVLLVPAVAGDAQGRVQFEQLVPSDELMEQVRRHLDARRMIGARVQLSPPRYLGVTVVTRVRARLNVDVAELRDAAVRSLFRYFDPLKGGPEGNGWPFGRPVLLGEVFSVLQGVPGLDLVEDARMFPADPITGERGDSVNRIDLESDSLVFSYGHQVQVLE